MVPTELLGEDCNDSLLDQRLGLLEGVPGIVVKMGRPLHRQMVRVVTNAIVWHHARDSAEPGLNSFLEGVQVELLDEVEARNCAVAVVHLGVMSDVDDRGQL